MRHRKDHRKLSRTASHRRSLLRNLVTALFQYERIETTVAKAKEARRLAERLITFGKRGDLSARRHVARFVTRPAVTKKLFDTIAPWYTERHGGYTRILRIGHRLGDAGETAYLELVKSAEQKEKERQDRLAAAEAKETALKGDKPTKKGKSEAATAAEEKPTRGRRRGQRGGGEECGQGHQGRRGPDRTHRGPPRRRGRGGCPARAPSLDRPGVSQSSRPYVSASGWAPVSRHPPDPCAGHAWACPPRQEPPRSCSCDSACRP